jgi:hypothetical protein
MPPLHPFNGVGWAYEPPVERRTAIVSRTVA